MKEYNKQNYKKVAIIGSFGKHYDIIVETAKKFIENGFEVLAPRLDGIRNTKENFIYLNGDGEKSPKELECDYICNCLEADLVYVCNKDGYIGTTVAFELGMLCAFTQQIFFMEKPKERLILDMIDCPDTTIHISKPERLIPFLKDLNSFNNAVDFFDDYNEPSAMASSFYLSEIPIIGVSKARVNEALKKRKMRYTDNSTK